MKSEHWQITRTVWCVFLSLEDSEDRWSSVPLVANHKLIGFADIELKVIVVGPCDGVFYQSPVLLCRNIFLSGDSMFLIEIHWRQTTVNPNSIFFVVLLKCASPASKKMSPACAGCRICEHRLAQKMPKMSVSILDFVLAVLVTYRTSRCKCIDLNLVKY